MSRFTYSGFFCCVLFLFLCVGCKPTERDANWQPLANGKMVEWFNKLNYQGYKGTTAYKLEFPKWFIGLKVPETKLTIEAVELGRFLFYDKSLSSDSSVSCASCHRQEASFSDTRRISLGVKGRLAKRNSMPLVNLILDRRFFWDGRAASLEAQIREPIADPNEMDLPLPELVNRLQKHPLYPTLFERAYGDKKITEDRLANAIAQFVTSIISYSMPEDYFRAVVDRRITPMDVPHDIMVYWKLFQQTQAKSNCGSCHLQALQIGQNRFENINPENKTDPGYYAVTKQEADRGKFKVLSLRNIALTGPYMHDGSVSSLRDALSHYRAGKFTSDSPKDSYRDTYGNLMTDKFTKEILDLYEKAFTANVDKKLISDPRFSNPF